MNYKPQGMLKWMSFILIGNLIHSSSMSMCDNEWMNCQLWWMLKWMCFIPMETLIHSSNMCVCVCWWMNYQLWWMLKWMCFIPIEKLNSFIRWTCLHVLMNESPTLMNGGRMNWISFQLETLIHSLGMSVCDDEWITSSNEC